MQGIRVQARTRATDALAKLRKHPG